MHKAPLLVGSQTVKFIRISSFSSICFTCPLLAGTSCGLFNMLSFNHLRKAFLTGLLETTSPEALMSLHMTPSYLTLIVKEAICLSRKKKKIPSSCLQRSPSWFSPLTRWRRVSGKTRMPQKGHMHMTTRVKFQSLKPLVKK